MPKEISFEDNLYIFVNSLEENKEELDEILSLDKEFSQDGLNDL